MKTVFVDANVFLRFFVADDIDQQERASFLFDSAEEGKFNLLTGPPVLFEIAWTLHAAYRLSHSEVLDVLEQIAGLPGLKLLDGAAVEKALALARAGSLSFADAYIAASALASEADEFATFNQRDFENPGVPLCQL